jgi:hypothetical protein
MILVQRVNYEDKSIWACDKNVAHGKIEQAVLLED